MCENLFPVFVIVLFFYKQFFILFFTLKIVNKNVFSAHFCVRKIIWKISEGILGGLFGGEGLHVGVELCLKVMEGGKNGKRFSK